MSAVTEQGENPDECTHDSIDSRALPNGTLRQTCNDCGITCDTERTE